jgi:hypothetical protein
MEPNPSSPRQGPTETSPLLQARDQEPHLDTVTDETDGGDLERQPSDGDSFKHQGLPELRKRMKYIFPAIAIGVSKNPLNHINVQN